MGSPFLKLVGTPTLGRGSHNSIRQSVNPSIHPKTQQRMLQRSGITRKLMVFFSLKKSFFPYKWLPETCSSLRLEGMGTTS